MCIEFGVIEDVINEQMQRMNAFKDVIFEKSQKEQELNEKMKYLFKTMHAINKLDHWTKLYAKFKKSREADPWYPVPALEQMNDVLKEVTNDDLPLGVIEMTIDVN